MSWLVDTHQISGAVLALAAFSIGATVAVVMGQYHDLANARWHQARTDACHKSARARAAERPRRQQLAPSQRQLHLRPRHTCPPPTALELARVVCPLYEREIEDRWLIRRRVHEVAA